MAKITVIVAVSLLVFLGFSYAGVEYYTSQSSFCGGSCHTMTEQYEAWKSDTHHANNNSEGKQAECIECHFLPGEKRSVKAKLEGLRHLAAYLYEPEAPLPIRPKIPDGACLQSGCHERSAFEETTLEFREGVRFKHQVHFSDKALDGHKLTCDTCHFKVTEQKHFEVPEEICFLCHLKLDKPELRQATMKPGEIQRISFRDDPRIEFNQGTSKCSICHTIPTRSLQAQKSVENPGDQPITHQTLQDRGVPCESCHFEVVKGHGEIETGNVVSNGCLRCHNRSDELLASASDKKRMHDAHIEPAKADCFDCHQAVEHRNREDHLDFVREDCTLCHDNQHRYQKMLLAGIPVADIPETPQLMAGVNTNCMACHIKKSVNRGHHVRTGSGEACVGCHTDEHDSMLKDWNTDVDAELKDAQEYEKEVRQALTDARGVVAEDILAAAQTELDTATELLNVVRYGNGVHNKKYAIYLVDQTFAHLDQVMTLLESGET